MSTTERSGADTRSVSESKNRRNKKRFVLLLELSAMSCVKERVAYAEIDWHDFCIVESVDFPLHERSDLPAPVTREELGVRMARMVRIEQTGYDEQAEQVQHREPEPQPEKTQQAPQEPQIIERDLGNEARPSSLLISILKYYSGPRANCSGASKTNGSNRIGAACSQRQHRRAIQLQSESEDFRAATSWRRRIPHFAAYWRAYSRF